jgi:uncharacterized protein (TIGR03435 family)
MRAIMKTIAALSIALALHAQPRATFEAVSIKPHPEPIYVSRSDTSGTYATWTAATLIDLVVEAWNVKYYQVTGGPKWAASAHFDINVRATDGSPLTNESRRPLIQSLLSDRFQLKVHRETKEIPVYALMVAKSGQKLKEPDMNSREGYTTVGPAGVHIVQSHATMQRLAEQLSNTAGRPVLDKTDLAGMFAYKLDFNPNSTPDSDIPSMPTALQDQLGLRLEPQKAPIEILIIDSAEKPSEN